MVGSLLASALAVRGRSVKPAGPISWLFTFRGVGLVRRTARRDYLSGFQHPIRQAMDIRLIARLVRAKLCERSTYILALVVGSLINLYGQLLVPWLRGAGDPFAVFASELETRPWLTLLSIFLGFAFPLCVGTYSSVATRYKNRRIESIADFPDRKPDPVFRARESGALVEVGAATRELFDRYGVDSAQGILGEDVWRRIVGGETPGSGHRIFFEREKAEYAVSHARTPNGDINVYLSRLGV